MATLLFTDDWEDMLNRASKIEDRINDSWMELLTDDEYLTLCDFFSADNFPHEDAFGERTNPATQKILKSILVGKDRIELIRYAFMLGQLVGQASIIVRDSE